MPPRARVLQHRRRFVAFSFQPEPDASAIHIVQLDISKRPKTNRQLPYPVRIQFERSSARLPYFVRATGLSVAARGSTSGPSAARRAHSSKVILIRRQIVCYQKRHNQCRSAAHPPRRLIRFYIRTRWLRRRCRRADSAISSPAPQ